MNEIRVCVLADLHTALPNLQEHDLTIIAGDVLDGNLQQQYNFYINKFIPWVSRIPSKKVILIAGNHCWLWQQAREICEKNLPPNVTYLQDSGTTIEMNGRKLEVWGTPWTPIFHDWAFNASPDEQEEYFSRIPEGLDILVSHGPPLGILDTNGVGENCGSAILRRHVERVVPKVCIFGHIHEARGYTEYNGTKFLNVAYLDGKYRQTRNPVYLTIA